MKQTDEVQLAFKREADPQGLLNPGKMIAWENPDYDYRSGKTFLFKGLQRLVRLRMRRVPSPPPDRSRRRSAMNILVLYAHPVETSFNAALHRLIVERLTAAGHSVDDCDLYAEDFDPRMTRAERLAYHDARGRTSRVAPYVERLLARRGAGALVSRSGTTAIRRS